jgi:Protein of unknown function (DUF3108)
MSEDQGVLSLMPAVCRAIALGSAAFTLLAAGAGPLVAQGKLDATYSAFVGGMPVGSGALSIEIGKREYQASGNGHVDGLMRMLSTSAGSVNAHGRVSRDHFAPEVYRASVTSGQLDYDVRMVLQAGGVKELIAEPPLLPAADRVPVNEAHRRGILDPASAVIMPVSGNGELVTPTACERTIPIFDGHQRFNLVLSFRRIDRVRAETGYAGPALVCSFGYQPIAGHRPGRFAVRYLQEQRDMEIWLAPISGTRALAPFRVSVPTSFGTVVIEAKRFVSVVAAPKATPTPTTARHAIHQPPVGVGSLGAKASRPGEESKGSAVNFVTAPATP